ncbi:uncharacterized protein PGTG_00188 [Puccinia graminis f. sp. tritici CRL 75-36-700-3]|uniref:Uncharacterized protein n=1 Tax=Puccinia graminis f. sp. tritici (strain CRL 75-36-700-3 / race SCCL) TaxID=418459 RepID=E3JQF3_PUCGT|nr:uncharacterized protein PGTG_00188 [Puccinia graminis f. sp. tritici CRL 75-36-700-3]EFP74232.1 hypothetical protein PGTG_00188 [Puccinia graminis f. sp. tritici CRL 75-36-700-3]
MDDFPSTSAVWKVSQRTPPAALWIACVCSVSSVCFPHMLKQTGQSFVQGALLPPQRVSQSRFRALKFKFLCKNQEYLDLDQLLGGSQIQREVLQWTTSHQHLRVSQGRIRALKFKFLCKNQEFLGLDQLLQGSQI